MKRKYKNYLVIAALTVAMIVGNLPCTISVFANDDLNENVGGESKEVSEENDEKADAPDSVNQATITYSKIKMIDKLVCTDGSGDTHDLEGVLERASEESLHAEYIVTGTKYTFSESSKLDRWNVHATTPKISGVANGKDIRIVFTYNVNRELFDELVEIDNRHNGGGGLVSTHSGVVGYLVWVNDQDGNAISKARIVQKVTSVDEEIVEETDVVGEKEYAIVGGPYWLWKISRIYAYVPSSGEKDTYGNSLDYLNVELDTYSKDPLMIYDEDGLLVATLTPKSQVLNVYGSEDIESDYGECGDGAPIKDSYFDIVYYDTNCKVDIRKNLFYTGYDGGYYAQIDVTINHQTRDFCKRLYTKCLGRKADISGVTYWEKQLNNKTQTGAGVGYGFVFSDEYKAKKTSDEEYVKMLYEVFMGRSADKSGLNYWLDLLNQGMSREYVYKGFAESKEFTNICASYGIERGSVKLTQARDQNVNLTKFVNRIYVKAMNRKGEEKGLNYWCSQIQSKKMTPVQVAESFIYSKEFTDKNLSNTEYIKVLYRTFMGREADSAGLNYWLGRLNKGESRKTVLKAFAGCQEFKNIVKSFGL